MNKFFILLLLTSTFASASNNIHCQVNNNVTQTVPLDASIYLGNSFPLGSIIYSAEVSPTEPPPDYLCTGDNNVFHRSLIPFSSSPSPVGNILSNNIYPTNVAGIGVFFTSSTSGERFSHISPTKREVFQSPSKHKSLKKTKIWSRKKFKISFIKIGPIQEGGTISGSSLPRVRRYMTPRQGSSITGSFPINMWDVSFSGAIKVETSTCTTPNVNVDLGNYQTSQFDKIGSATPWVDSSIRLENCPIFHGYFNEENYQTSQGTTPTGSSINNSIEVKLSPLTDIFDSKEGIIKLNNNNGSSAQGIGIKIAQGSESRPANWDFDKSLTIEMPKNHFGSMRVPLFSRYIRTSEVLRGGQANAQVLFTINYR